MNRYESVQYRDAVLMATVEKIPEIKQLLSYIGQCALCGGPFVNSWLDCVEFVHTKNVSRGHHYLSTLSYKLIYSYYLTTINLDSVCECFYHHTCTCT